MTDSSPDKFRILIIDDDVELNALLEEYLQGFGHRLTSATTAAAGRDQLRRELPDLLILDVMLPDTDGLTLCREFSAEYDLPIIMLTARGDTADKVMGLELGADDYLAKPFEPRELVARIQSVIRRSQDNSAASVLVCDGLRVELDTRRVDVDGKAVELTTMEFELLKDLMQSRGRSTALSRVPRIVLALPPRPVRLTGPVEPVRPLRAAVRTPIGARGARPLWPGFRAGGRS